MIKPTDVGANLYCDCHPQTTEIIARVENGVLIIITPRTRHGEVHVFRAPLDKITAVCLVSSRVTT